MDLVETCCVQPRVTRQTCEHISQERHTLLPQIRLITRYLAGRGVQKKRMKLQQTLPSPSCFVCGSLTQRVHISLHSPVAYCWKHLGAHFSSTNANFAICVSSLDIYCNKCSDYVYFTDYQDLQTKWSTGPSKINPDILQHVKVPCLKDHKLGLRGLVNLGNTCFMNVLLQVFINNPLLQQYFLEDKHSLALCEKTGVCISCEMEEVFNEMFSGKKAPYSPSNLMYSIWKTEKDLAGYDQQDTHEFFMVLLSGMQMANKGVETTAHSLFSGTFRSDVICLNCSKPSPKSEEFVHISLDCPPETLKRVANGEDYEAPGRLTECLERYCQAENLQEPSFCTHCKSKQRVAKQISIEKMPPVLCLHFKRFKQEHTERRKIETLLSYEEILDMTPFSSEDILSRRDKTGASSSSKCLYRLFGVVNHIGHSIDSGHYTCYIFHLPTGQWYKCNDHIVSKASEKAVLSNGKQVYLLFYTKVDCLTGF